MEIIQKNIASHSRENIYEVKEIEAELGLASEEAEEDVGL